MTTDAGKRKATFDDGEKFINNINGVSDLYTAVITDITERSFKNAGWHIDTKVVNSTTVLVPVRPTGNRDIIFAISQFDTITSPPSTGNSTPFPMISVAISDFHYAWAGDEMPYIDMVASALFMRQQ